MEIPTHLQVSVSLQDRLELIQHPKFQTILQGNRNLQVSVSLQDRSDTIRGVGTVQSTIQKFLETTMECHFLIYRLDRLAHFALYLVQSIYEIEIGDLALHHSSVKKMSWIIDTPLSYVQKFCVNVLKVGPIPEHIAFIMDGNRRYATKAKIQTVEGHSKGFNKLAEALQWCSELGVSEVTVYAFSIENFKRSKDEVDALMKLATEKFKKLFEEKEKLMENGVCIRVIGNYSLLSPDLRKLVAQAMMMTKDNNKAFLNVAFAYTSRDEMATTIKTVVEAVRNKSITVEDIDEDLFNNCLFTRSSKKPDMLIRTSGEIRFSDFLLWQISSNCFVCFSEVLWPEFSLWNFLACVFKYQRAYSSLRQTENSYSENHCRVEEFLKTLEERRFTQLQCFANA